MMSFLNSFIRVSSLLLLALAGMARAEEAKVSPEAELLWKRGQVSLEKGNAKQAVSEFREALQASQDFAKAHYSMAVACLSLGNDLLASVHLKIYLDLEPENIIARQNFADLLLRLEQVDQARDQFERFIQDAQKFGAEAHRLLIHSHSRLMTIAQQEGDQYSEHLHRGIGMYYLGLEIDRNPANSQGEPQSREAILFRAAAELTQARMLRTDQVKSCWYLYLVWDRLSCSQPASRWLRLVSQDASLTQLSPREFEEFQLVSKVRETTFPRK